MIGKEDPDLDVAVDAAVQGQGSTLTKRLQDKTHKRYTFHRFLFVLQRDFCINNAYKHSDITSRIIASALEVHTVLGNGFQEVIYTHRYQFCEAKVVYGG